MNLNKVYQPLFINPPTTRYFLLTGGRGSAKSFHVSTFLLNLTYEKGHTILFTRYTMIAAHISIIPEFLEKIDILGKHADFEITKTDITNKATGSKILFRGIKTSSGNQTANLKSIQGVTTWVLDEAEELTEENTFNTIDLSIRHKSLPNRVIMVMNPSHRTHFIYKRWFEGGRQPDTTYIHTSYRDNIDNLSQSFIDQAAKTKAINEERYNHLFLRPLGG
jgi:phage terminase large subunit